jgi:hypothetical protein
MEAVQQLLSATDKGDGTIYRIRKCLNRKTLYNQRLALDVMRALDDVRSRYRDADHFQPSHAAELGAAFRRQEKDPAKWTPQMKAAMAHWMDRIEEEELTVQQLRHALLADQAQPANGQPAGSHHVRLFGTLTDRRPTASPPRCRPWCQTCCDFRALVQ